MKSSLKILSEVIKSCWKSVEN